MAEHAHEKPPREPDPPPPEVVPDERVKVGASLVRCPYCHDAVKPESTDWVACRGCLARHHESCWSEHAKCATCAGTTVLETRARPAGQGRVFAALIATVGVLAVVTLPLWSTPPEVVTPPRPAKIETPAPLPGVKHDARPHSSNSPFTEKRKAPLFERAFALTARGDLAAAVDEYTRIVKALDAAPFKDRFFKDAIFNRALLELELDRLEVAHADLSTVLRLDRGDGSAFAMRALVSERMDDIEGAIADLKRALEIVDDDADGAWLEAEIERLTKKK
jgi:tetratricopeptide (TPR) repeat protein